MTPERWQKIDSLVQEALEREPQERARFFDDACKGDDELRQEVESLLASNQTESFLQSPALENAAALIAHTESYSLLGQRLGPYRIISQLGAGGMGEVYLAHDSRLKRKVALKILPAYFTKDEQRLRRFQQEARAASALNHPNIITIFDIGEVDSIHYIATEHIDGETLRQQVTRKMKIDQILDVAVQVAGALEAAHQAGIVHRDIKPENIMVRPDGYVKVLDFGLAKPRHGAPGASDAETTVLGVNTEPGVVMGTANYMSPEQARGREMDGRTDVFSLGVVIYEMVAGRVPFEGETTSDVIAAVLGKEPAPLESGEEETPEELQRIVMKALRKDRAERYQTAGELLNDLKNLKRETDTGAATVTGASSYDQGRRASLLQSKALVASLLLVVALTAILLWWQPWTRRPTAQPQQRLISTFPGSPGSASFSPDGSRIAFITAVDGHPQVWVKDLTQGDPVQITFGSDRASRPRWSPTGEQIIFVRSSQGSPGIWSVPPEGGTPLKVIEGGRNPNWSWDSKRLVFERGYGEIWIANADGSDQHRIEGVPSIDLPRADRMPAFSPDGSLVVYFQEDKGPIGDYWIIPSAGGQARRLTFDVIHGGAPAFTPDGKFIICPSQRAGSKTLWKVPVSGGQLEPVLLGAGEDFDPEISRDGRKLMYTNTRNSYTLGITDLATRETKTLVESRVDIFDPSFSPQGDKILFFGMTSEGDIHVSMINADGSHLTQVTRGKGERNIHPRWSADGSAVYFYQIRPTTSFRKISTSESESSELVSGWEWGTQFGARVDPQGKRIIYARLDKGSVVATMIRDLETGRETAFTTLLNHPTWSRDGRFVLGVDGTSVRGAMPGILICPADGGACRKITKGYFPHWSPDNMRIFFQRDGNLKDGKEVWSLSLDGRDERHIIDLRPMHPIGQFFDISAKGQIVWARFDRGKNELWLSDLPDS